MSYNNGIPKDGLHVERIVIKPVSSSYAMRVCATTDCNQVSHGKKYCQSCMNKFETEHNKKRDYYFGVNEKLSPTNNDNLLFDIRYYNEFVEHINGVLDTSTIFTGWVYKFKHEHVQSIYHGFVLGLQYSKLKMKNHMYYTYG